MFVLVMKNKDSNDGMHGPFNTQGTAMEWANHHNIDPYEIWPLNDTQTPWRKNQFHDVTIIQKSSDQNS